MLTSNSRFVWLLGAALLIPGVSGAAEPLVIENEPAFDGAAPLSGSWYLRGDFGVGVFNDPSTSYNFQGGTTTNLTGEEFGNSFNVGFGIGRKFNDFFRADVTLDTHLDFDFTGDDVPSPFPCDFSAGPGRCDQVLSSEVELYTGLLNGYFDLGTFNGFTPYVGGGVGATYVRFDEFAASATCTGCADPAFNALTLDIATESELEFAYQLTAGASVAISDVASIDFSYRYLDIDDAFAVRQGDTFIKFEDLETNDFRIGFRYAFQ